MISAAAKSLGDGIMCGIGRYRCWLLGRYSTVPPIDNNCEHYDESRHALHVEVEKGDHQQILHNAR